MYPFLFTRLLKHNYFIMDYEGQRFNDVRCWMIAPQVLGQSKNNEYIREVKTL